VSLVFRLLLLVALSVLPPTLLDAWREAGERREQQAEIRERVLHMASLAAAEQRRIAEGARQLMVALSMLPVIQHHDAGQCSLTLRHLHERYPIYTAIGVASPAGQVWCSSSRPGTDVSDRPGFRAAVATRAFTVGGYVVGRIRGLPTLNFNQPFYDEDNGLLGVLIVGLDLRRLAADLEREPLPPGATLAAVDPNGYVLVDLPGSAHVGKRLPERLRDLAAKDHPGVIDTEWINGARQIVGYVPAAARLGPPVMVALGLDHGQVYGDAARRNTRARALSLAVLATALLAAWWFATRFIRRPLARLTAVAGRWREGDLAARVGQVAGGPEIGRVGQAFDAMADAIAERERRLSDMLESTTDSVWAVDRDWRVTFLNDRARARMKGYDLLGKQVWEAFPDMVGGPVWAAFQKAMAERVPTEVTFFYASVGGHFETHVFPSPDGGITLFVREVTEQVRAKEALRHLAYHDPLTGLPNRTTLNEAAARAMAEQAPVALSLLDLDGFKHVNDTMGHAAGDAVLRAVAARLTPRAGSRGLLARLGGDEFALLLSGEEAVAEREAITAALLQALEEAPFPVGDRIFRITASAGLVLAPPGHGTPERLLADADLALYRAKAAGGSVFRAYSVRDREEYEDRRLLEEEIGQAAERGEFVLHYQPQVHLADGRLIGAEALLRWRHPRRGLLAPAAFLEALESSRHAQDVGDWIIDEACRQAAEWRRAGLSLRVGANLFSEQLRVGGLDAAVGAALARWDLPAEALELELTENIALRQEEDVLTSLRALRARGIGLAFDDFGTGFASLVTLRDVPVTRLKIDRSFITGVADLAHDAAIVEAVLALGRGLGLGVIAEGIETAEQERFLIGRGCQEGQGYRYGRPMPAGTLLSAGLAHRAAAGRWTAPPT
jgi:diguanylate cyclase (GGDEF)-like protein/PAS domain S-box-containing protein